MRSNTLFRLNGTRIIPVLVPSGYNYYRRKGYISWIHTFRLKYKACYGLVTNGCRCNHRG
nr:MAG TPA: hypothetical protein [Caudoviricetes sp.]